MTEDGRQGTEKAALLRPLALRGFTLVEMAVVLVVIGFIILTVLPALNAVRMSNSRTATRSNLQALMTATAAYVQANGCVPCPAPATATGTAFGVIPGFNATSKPCGTCTSATAEGVAPYISLGISASTAEDGWGRWITMRVDPALTNPPNIVVPPTKPMICTCSTPIGTTCTASPVSSLCTCPPAVNGSCTPNPPSPTSEQGLCASGLSQPTTSRITVQTQSGASQQAAVVFVSHGSNGYGSYFASARSTSTGINGCRLPFPSVAAACLQTLSCSILTTSLGDAECNASGTPQFVDAPMQPNGSGTYDDLLAYADRNTLVSMFGNGSCQTVW